MSNSASDIEGNSLEIEVKFHLKTPQETRKKIVGLGAVSQGRVFEKNTCYDYPGGGLAKRGELLRVRQAAETILTHKSPHSTDHGQFKIRQELEVKVDDPAAMHRILSALNFHPTRRYEKWRETLHLDKTLFCLDQMPFGDFLEIEGSQESILDYSRQLGLAWRHRILANYLGIFTIIKHHLNLEFDDPTFTNFKDLKPSLQPLLHLMQSG